MKTKEEAAALLGISVRSFERHVLRAIHRGIIGGETRFDERDLES
jgi:hypothetical protein